MTCFSIRLLAHETDEMAARIHAVQTVAYRQEALLLEVRDFPPLKRRVEDVRTSSDTFFGAFDGEELVGVISLERQTPDDVLIFSLTVTPSFQRSGVARALIAAVADQTSCKHITVSTGAKNHPAVILYTQLGFVVCGQKYVGPEQLEIVEFTSERSDISVKAQTSIRG